jgi:beta-lactam-binding protein with PASTA domain
MDIKYDEYLEKGTEKLLEIFSSSDISDEEKEVLVTAFSNELISNIGDTSNLQDYEFLIYSVSLKYVDDCLSKSLANNRASYSDCERAIKYCYREKEILQVFQAKKWDIPGISNNDLDKSETILKVRQESASLISKILEEDHKIDDLIYTAQTELSMSFCDSAQELLEELSNDLTICKQKKISVPAVNNKDAKKTAKKISDIRITAEKKECLHQEMYSLDSQIDSMVSAPKTTPTQWEEILSLCQKQAELDSECSKNQWPQPSALKSDINVLITKYQLYLRMKDLDQAVVSSRDKLESRKQYDAFFSNCAQLSEGINICTKNKWTIPELVIKDPRNVEVEARAEKNQKDLVKQKKRVLTLTMVGVFFAFVIAAIGIIKYREGKVKIPFNPYDVVGQDIAMVYEELNSTGFSNISKVPDYSGWQNSNTVTGVSIDNKEDFKKGKYKKTDVDVSISYSNEGRIYMTDSLAGWNKKDYASVEEIFTDNGITNVTTEQVATRETNLDGLVESLSLNELEYIDEICYLPENAPVVIRYYVYKIEIGTDSNDFIGQGHQEVVSKLKGRGFSNIKSKVIKSGWAKDDTVVGISAEGKESFDSTELIAPGADIEIQYSSSGRTDITDIVSDWQTSACGDVFDALKSKGFNNVTTRSKPTTEIEQNQLITVVEIGEENYVDGACYVSKSAPIVLEYYTLEITMPKKASKYTGENYSDVVYELKKMGFNNIRLLRSDNLINELINHEGDVKRISIDGYSSFKSKETFSYDSLIEIVVYTYKGKGLEDITEVADY